MSKSMTPEQFRAELQSLGVDVSRETMTALQAYAALLLKWQKAINLVSKTTLDDLWRRHFLDSAQLLPLLSPETPITDFGSGAGFPGLVLAIMANRRAHLVESDQRKAAFLMEAARATGCAGGVEVHAERVERLKAWKAGIITARALTELGDLLALAEPFLAPETICVFPKGAKADDELTAAGLIWTMNVERRRSLTDSTGLILKLSQIARRGQT